MSISGRAMEGQGGRGSQDRLSLFLTSFAGGGAERAMVLLAGGLAQRGFSVDLVVTRARGPYFAEVPKDIRVVDLNAHRIISSLPSLVRYLRRERPPLLLSTLSATNCVALWARDMARVNTTVVVNEQTTRTKAHANTPHRRMRMLPKLMQWTYPRADGLTAISAGAARDLARLLEVEEDDIRVIYNPVVTNQLESRAMEPVDHSWFRPGQPPVILSVGRLVQAKDFPTLLRAFALLRNVTDARLMILGEGERRQSLEVLAEELAIEDHVALPGFVANPYAYMAHSSVFALSSRWEGLGMGLIEAMACGTPVVSTDCPNGPHEILEGGRWGRLAPVGSPEHLADALVSTLNDPGPDPRRRAAYFSVDRAVEQYLEVLGLAQS